MCQNADYLSECLLANEEENLLTSYEKKSNARRLKYMGNTSFTRNEALFSKRRAKIKVYLEDKLFWKYS